MSTKNKKRPLKAEDRDQAPSSYTANLPRLFLLIGGFFGLIMLVLTPPFQVPDEHDHFFRAVMISSGQFVAKSYPFPEELKKKVPQKYLRGKGGVVPVSIPYTTRKVNHRLPFHNENKQKLSDLKKMLTLPLHMKGQPEVFINTSAGDYAPPLYLPAVMTISVGKALNLSPLWLMYLGRLANLIVFLSLTYWALKITPTGKSVLFLLALMPMTLFLAHSLSIDGLTIASSFLLTATLLNLARNDNQPVKLQDFLIVPATLTLLALGKVVYCPLILLFFLSPKVLFSTDRSRLYLFASSLGLAAISYLIWHWLTKTAGTATVANIPFDYTSFQAKDKLMPLLNSKKQLQFLLNYPSSIFTILGRTLQDQGRYYIESFIGLLGWLDTKLPTWIYMTFPLALIIEALGTQTTSNHAPTEKTLLMLIWLLSNGTILLGFYLLSTPVGNAIIGGVQGRYFIPTAVPLLLFFSLKNNLSKLPEKPFEYITRSLPYYILVVLICTTYTLWYRYY